MNAIWGMDYDFHTDKTYNRPVCPECEEPIGEDEDRVYRCYNCGKEVEVTDLEMKQWFAVRKETKVVMEDCPKIFTKDGKHLSGCGGKKCVETLYRRNPVNLEWEVCSGRCTQCSTRFIV